MVRTCIHHHGGYVLRATAPFPSRSLICGWARCTPPPCAASPPPSRTLLCRLGAVSFPLTTSPRTLPFIIYYFFLLFIIYCLVFLINVPPPHPAQCVGRVFPPRPTISSPSRTCGWVECSLPRLAALSPSRALLCEWRLRSPPPAAYSVGGKGVPSPHSATPSAGGQGAPFPFL